ncbi:uncharacterized protein B0I36DRAFT_282680 [Microdochium trichocladiopsis]|uniref:Alpha/Beta hydrolase protein n=1 Tax=Microdochium trichocladiopsis TaxID=1682393 RepID=A0A9P8YCP9_9PEZI|nr:uncharacterized protein B0I36DRAFT_282680 [Microdochium trichocladiopsis]KAH7037025.1 hypothetical protein B0I36DRAFT_282680 [Microdochium trichocladiopsis]
MRTTTLAATLLGAASAVPGLLGGVTGLVGGLTGALQGTLDKIDDQLNDVGVVGAVLLAELGQIKPTATPSSIKEVASIVKKVGGAKPTALLQSAVELVLNGLGPTSLEGVIQQYSAGSNSENNVNTREPAKVIFPSADADDVPYSITEEKLRAAIYIPDTFTYGKKPPVVLVPGTATKGGLCYEPNLAKLLPQEDYADPVWLNIPGWLLEEVPWNAEFVAYAINYISGITSQNVSVIALSQGNLDTQWAFTYWPSTRHVVSDYIAVSPDYHGSVLLNVLCPKLGLLSCPPAVSQQLYNAKFIEAFRRVGGASAYVPTTTVYSATDDVVQPQSGANASAYLQDERGVGVLNVELQKVCPLASPALVGTHESSLWGAPLQALIKDALTHDGPADISRIPDWNAECSKIAADGLNLEDVIGTTFAVPVAFAAMFLYPKRVTTEPALPSYVQ